MKSGTFTVHFIVYAQVHDGPANKAALGSSLSLSLTHTHTHMLSILDFMYLRLYCDTFFDLNELTYIQIQELPLLSIGYHRVKNNFRSMRTNSSNHHGNDGITYILVLVIVLIFY